MFVSEICGVSKDSCNLAHEDPRRQKAATGSDRAGFARFLAEQDTLLSRLRIIQSE
jgi:hypothetical protein